MIEKMKFLSILGPRDDIDRVVDQYLTKYEIHLKNALTELKLVQSLTPFQEINPYRERLKLADEYIELLPEKAKNARTGRKVTLDEALDAIEETFQKLAEINTKRDALIEKCRENQDLIDKVKPFHEVPFALSDLFRYRFIRCRFGRIPKDYYTRFSRFFMENPDILFYTCQTDAQYVWGIYFTPQESMTRIDAMLTGMHFERVYVPDSYEGMAEDAYHRLIAETRKMDDQLKEYTAELTGYLESHASLLLASRKKLADTAKLFDIRKFAACTTSDSEPFYILCGWMTAKDAESLQEDIKDEQDLFCLIEENDEKMVGQPPTKLKNPKLFKPFEGFVRMYGLPGYHEFDPTIYLAITYSFIFGIMFGDVGQGACLMLFGLIAYRLKKKSLFGILAFSGLSATIWGFIFNSFFGFEGFFPYEPLIRAKEDMVTLPMLGSMNLIFVLAIAFGMFMILLNIVMGIINAVKAHDKENTWFSQNALAGLVFYGSIVALVFLYMTGFGGLSTLLPLLLILIVVSLIIIFLKELLGRIASKRKPYIEGGAGMYFVQAFFETFETLLSFLSNTLSYVRIGAYAVSHAAMMEVVMMLAGAEAGNPSLPVIIIGNIFVALMECLMVSIQVLRLEYYEMFSRFYKGNGHPFKPFIRKAKK